MSVDPPHPDTNSDDELLRRAKDETDAKKQASSVPPVESTETLRDAPTRLPKEIGRYHVKRVIASGGMGTVYEAVQEHPRRTVAVKVMKHGIASRSAMRRFEYESQILARLRHPGIAQVFEAGTHDDGSGAVPFFAMEYIPNAKPITQYATEKKLGTRERLDLFGKVCDAVHHGHQKGIIHRDLKPGNILVDSHGQPRIIDFGVARATDSDLAVTTLQTDVGQLIGTMQYMSPEQCEADPHDLDIRSDVYALGVVLYELLCRKLPYDVSKVAVYEATRMVREHQPTRLSTMDRTLRGDVETIVFKALEKDRERRYQSAVELNQDIKRYLCGEAIVARPPSIVYQLRVFARRNKAFFGAVAAVFVVLIAGVIVSTSLYLRSETARRDAIQAREAEAEQRRLADGAKQQAEADRDEARRQAYLANIAAAEAARSKNEIATVRRRLDAAPDEFRDWEWRYMYAESDNSLAVLRGHEGLVWSVEFSPDGTRLASASGDKTVRLWDASSSKELLAMRGHERSVMSVTFTPDGTRLASASADATVRIWDARTGGELAVLRGHEGYVRRASFSPDGTRLASIAIGDGTIRLWDAFNGAELALLRGHDVGVNTFVFSPDGKRLATGADDRTIRIWDALTGGAQAVLRGHEGDVNDVRFSPDGTRLASASSDGTIRIWNAFTGEELSVLSVHKDGVYSVAFSPDGTCLASASWDKTVRLWNASTGEQVAGLATDDTCLAELTFSPDGARLAATSDDKTIRVWNTASGEEVAILRGHEDRLGELTFNPDGTRLASGSADDTVRIWDVETQKRLSVLEGHEDYLWFVAFSPDGTRIASGGGSGGTTGDNSVRLWDPATGEELAILKGHDDAVWGLAFSPDGSLVVSGSDDRTARVWGVGTGEELVVLRGHEGSVPGVAFNPDGTLIATASSDKTVRLWESATGRELAVLRGHEDLVWGVAFSPDGSTLASGSHDKEKAIRLWDTSTGEQLGILKGHERTIDSIAFSPNGERLASASWDHTIRLWDMATHEELNVLRGHEGGVCSVAFNSDGTRLVSSSYDGTVRLWDASTGEELIALRGHQSIVGAVAFSGDGARLASAAADKSVRIWDTVPFRVRYHERNAILSARPKAERIVDELWQQPIDARSIADRLREDSSLSEPQRRAALNLLLSKSAQLQHYVNDLYARLVFTEDVAAALEANDSLSPGVRYKAVAIVRAKGDKSLRLNHDIWNLVRSTGGNPEAYKLGLQGARATVAVEPDNVDFLNTLGMAQYRNGHLKEAFSTLTRCEELRRQRGVKSVPRDVAALAMTLFKLRRVDEARAAYERLRKVMNDPQEDWSENETATALFKECRQLLESSNAQSEHPESKKVEE